MTVFRIKKRSALGLTLNVRGAYKTREAAQRKADSLNDKAGHMNQYYVAVETEAERDVREAFAQQGVIMFGVRVYKERKLIKRDAKKKVFGSTQKGIVEYRSIPKRHRNRLLSVKELEERRYGDKTSYGKRMKDYYERNA